jgi:homogentisate 1,2-dioxygenase
VSTPTILRGLSELPAALSARGVRRLFVITTPGRRFLDALPLDGLEVEVFDGAAVHVPRSVVEAAERALVRSEAEAILTLGGGSATGLGKALRLTHDVPFIAVPTTYAGSEMTRVYGITDEGDKRTGREERARPDVVVHEPGFFLQMPKALTVTSLLNALAHPVSALARGELDEVGERDALRAIEKLSYALEQLLEAPASPDGRAVALEGMALAGSVLDRAAMGAQHAIAHRLGGHFALDHSGLHAVLIPHFVRRIAASDAARYASIAEAAGHADLPAVLYDALTRAGVARSLVELGAPLDALEALAREHAEVGEGWVRDAWIGRRPSVHVRREGEASVWGPAPKDAERVVIAVHGRGGNAGRTLKDALDLVGHDARVRVIAPQAPTGTAWYPRSYRASLAEHGEDLSRALSALNGVLDEVLKDVDPSRVFLYGFSQGACLATELVARGEHRFGGLVALAGARIGPQAEQPAVRSALAGMPVLLGASAGDSWVDAVDVEHTAAVLREAGADVTVVASPGEMHEASGRARVLAQELLRGVPLREGQTGFGNAHRSEALPGALPRHQNSPRKAPYGLFAEQINGTGFAVRREHNLRAWLYRIRPAAQHTPFAPLAHPTLLSDWDEGPPEPNLSGHRALPWPEAPTDFVDGLHTFGGAGHPRLRRGYAVHLYVANRSMEHRAFYDADGDLVILPQEGALTLLTELGVLDVDVGQIAIVPRGLKVSVLLQGERARGYVGEVYGRHFELPERGPVGSNGLTDARHFRAPTAWFEDRVDPGYRITAKLGNALFEATQDHSPYDAVAWHGNYVPYVYDLADFSPVGNTRFDHPDPSIYTALSAPLDEAGVSSLDLVFFAPRWDATEHTFRPPYFHRNATTEINGILSDPTLDPRGPFAAGGIFVTPSMTAHGVLTRAVERALRKTDQAADRPARNHDASRWFQFESALPIGLTSWARAASTRDAEWPLVWGAYRPHFDPTKRG